MANVTGLPNMMTSRSSWSPEQQGNRSVCPICGRKKEKKLFDFLGVQLSVTPACECEVREYEKDMEEFKKYEEREAKKRLLAESGLSGNANDYTFEKFITRPGAEKALQVAQSFVSNFEFNLSTGQGITFFGTYGNGKSHLAAAIVHSLVKNDIPASFQSVTELLLRVRATYDQSSREETEASIMRVMQNVKCLVLDDIGAQKTTEWVESFLYTIIDYRYSKKLPTIFTTNCNAVERSLSEAIGMRSVDRLLERNLMVKITASSYRREIARQRMSVMAAAGGEE